jgi:hypothetical protein
VRQDFSWEDLFNFYAVVSFRFPSFLLFLLLGVIIIYLSLISEAWIFDKSNSLFIKQTKLPLMKIRFSESLTNFQELQIIQLPSNEGSDYYELKILFKSNVRYKILGIEQLQKIEEVAIILGDFLQIPINKIMLDKVNETERDLN